ncbi:MAG: YcaO-like family protein [Vulcanimicrobiaceae bacterium]
MLMLAQREPKASGYADRSVPLEATLRLVPELCRRYGITRIGDTTHLDRIGIPTYCAIVPRSADLIGVYNGKGLSHDAARASAVMEAAERQIATQVRLPTFHESVARIDERLSISSCDLLPEARDLVVECVEGTDLLCGTTLAVPLAMVQCPWFGPRLFRWTSTNGLASGNTLTEAIYHALCELIERHSWSLYEARCHLLARFYLGRDAGDLPFARAVALPSGNAAVDALAQRIAAAGLELRAFWLAADPLPMTVLATVSEPGSDPPMAHLGMGTSLSGAYALIRAITEAVQSRVVDIQGAREDILRADEPAGITGEHGRRRNEPPRRTWCYDLPTPSVALDAVADRSSDDVAEDLRRLLTAMREAGMQHAVIVDLSPADLPIHVVRAIAPECETYAIDGRIGPKVLEALNPFSLSR